MEIKFRRDTSFRKQFFVPDSFAHPAKMDSQLLIWIVENYTEAGETIADVMAGSGTTMLACMLGRNVLLVELEEKFCKMMRDNWEIVKMHPQLGCEMGACEIIQGDARDLRNVLFDDPYGLPPEATEKFDKIVASPPYTETLQRWGKKETLTMKQKGLHQESKNGIGSLPYGNIDSIITSPPYTAFGASREGEKIRTGKSKIHKEKSLPTTYTEEQDKANIGNLPYKEVDSIITSPPYEDQTIRSGSKGSISSRRGDYRAEYEAYDNKAYNLDNADNIGNLKSNSYLSAMLQVYQNCYSVLRNSGLMILVTKNFIRNKQVIRLDTDTIKLCEQAGFKFLERHYRRLPAQSFWRIIALLKCDYRKGSKQDRKCGLGLQCPIKVKETISYLLGLELEKREEAIEVIEKLCPSFINSSPKIDYEDILVFQKFIGL